MQIIAAVLSAVLFAAPGVHNPDPDHGRHLKQKPASPHRLAADVPPGWESLDRDARTLIYRRTAVDTQPSNAPGTDTKSDFDGDGKDDVAVFSDSGVIVRYSSAPHRDQLYTDMPEGGCVCFGYPMVYGDFNGDTYDDLAVGDMTEVDTATAGYHAGAVWIFYGGSDGLRIENVQHLNQSTEGVPGTPESGDIFGWGVAIGKVDKNNYAELLIGAPIENEGDLNDGSGLVTQFWGSATGASLSKVTSVNGEAITATANITGMYAWEIGFSLGVTDTNGDGYGEVIIGDRGAEVGWDLAPGAVFSLAGRSTGLSATGVKVLSQDSTGVAGATESEDWFGDSIAVGDVTGDGLGDVLVGVPGEDIGTLADAGSVVLLRGSSSGLTGTNSQSLDQGSDLVPGSAEALDGFGDAVGMLNLDGTGPLEALVGTPGEEVTGDDKGYPSGTVTAFPVGSGGLRLGVTTTGKSLVPAGEYMGRYGFYLAGPQGS